MRLRPAKIKLKKLAHIHASLFANSLKRESYKIYRERS